MKCTFCGETMVKGKGKMFVKSDGKVLYFCSGKCEKNMLKLKKKPHTTKWTSTYHKQKKSKK